MNTLGPERRHFEGQARALGWFSAGLGVPQIVAPAAVNHLIGVADGPGARAVMRAIGVREVAAAAGLLAPANPPPAGLWARVAGDAVDVALLLAAATSPKNDRRRVLAATAAVAGVLILDVVAGVARTRSRHGDGNGTAGESRVDTAGKSEDHHMHAKSVLTINRPVEEVYRYCRDLEHLARIFDHVESVEITGERSSRWTMNAAGQKIEWDTEITDDVPNQLIAWRAVEDGMEGSGSVRFAAAPGGQGTEVTVELDYGAPGGAIGAALMQLIQGDTSEHVREDLRRLKQILEVGEVVRSDGTPDGPRPLRQLRQRPAQPLP